MGRKAAETPAAPAIEAAPSGEVHIDEGNTPSSRPGPRPVPVATGIAAPARTDVSVGIGAPSAKDVNERQWQAKQTKLREDAIALGAKLNEGRDLHPPLFGTRLDDEDSDDTIEAEKPAAAAKPDADATKKAELASIAAKDRENRDLRRKLKAIEATPKKADREAKLRELAKTNPEGVAEYLGIDFEQLAVAKLAGKKAEAIKFDDDAPAKPGAKAEPTETEKELEQERARRIALEQREAQRGLNTQVEKLVKDTKVNGALRWGNVAKLGDEGRTPAIANAQAFAAGRIDEKGQPLATPRRMRKMSDADAKAVIEHFLDVEDTRLGNVAKKLGAASQRPEPRRTQAGAKRSPMETADDPRKRKSYIEIGEEVRARFFGRR